MPEFEIQCSYLQKVNKKFFNDKEKRKYHQFLVTNSKIIPKECLHFSEDRGNHPCMIWILDDFIKVKKIDFDYPQEEAIKKYKFIINLGEEKVAKFNINNKNWMVLKTTDYFENTIKKIGFWDSDDYFYESVKKPKKGSENLGNIKSENKIEWGKIALFCLPIFLLFFLIFLIVELANKKIK
jgi:hypothetical protein